MSQRNKTNYPGVYYIEGIRRNGKEPEKIYYIVFRKEGKQYEEKAGRQYEDNMTPAKASRIRAERIEGKRISNRERREQIKRRKEAEKNRWTISRLWQEYKRMNPELKGLCQDENRFTKHIEPRFGSKEPQELNPFEVDKLRIDLGKNHKPATVKNVLELLRRIIRFGKNKHLCNGLPFSIQMPRVDNIKTEDLSHEELQRLLKAINEEENIQIANLMRMALYTGMRRGELFCLQWEDIDFQRGFILIRNPKGGKSQSIPLNDSARDVLSKHPQNDSPYVFPGRNGEQRTDAKRPLRRVCERAGLPKDFRPLHGLRHVYASMLASSGEVDMYTLQKLLTHKSPQMTQRYAHLRDEQLKKASNLVGKLVSENQKSEQTDRVFNIIQN